MLVKQCLCAGDGSVGISLNLNDTRTTLAKVRENLATAISICPTWRQICWFALDGVPPSGSDEDDYLEFLTGLLCKDIHPQGVLLYGLAVKVSG